MNERFARRKLLTFAVLLSVGLGAVAFAIAAESQPEGRTMSQRFGPRDREFVVRGSVVDKGIRPISSIKDAELSENAQERRQLEAHFKSNRWMAFIDVEVTQWVKGRGTHGNGPKSIVVLHGMAIDDKGEQVWSPLSEDWQDREMYDKFNVGDEYEFHLVTESFYGRYFGVVYAYPIVDGVVQDTSLDGFKFRE